MKIVSKAYGPIEVDDQQKLFFPMGILGFEDLKDYVLLDAKQPPFYWLQSLDTVAVAFVLINPRLFIPEYEIEVEEMELEEIGITSVEDMLDFAIVTIPNETSQMTANLQGPIIINRKIRHGRQCISKNSVWQIRHKIVDEMTRLERARC